MLNYNFLVSNYIFSIIFFSNFELFDLAVSWDGCDDAPSSAYILPVELS